VNDGVSTKRTAKVHSKNREDSTSRPMKNLQKEQAEIQRKLTHQEVHQLMKEITRQLQAIKTPIKPPSQTFPTTPHL
jgi:uncharacterized FlaG/YvyC family protein